MKFVKKETESQVFIEKIDTSFSLGSSVKTDVYKANYILLEKWWISLEDYFHKTGAWWIACSVDIYDCDPNIIRDSNAIKHFVRELCELIKMKRFQDTNVVHFWEDEKVAGFSMTQLIETSLISWHFANNTNVAYLDIFSCKYYDPLIMANYAQKFFKWKNYKINVNLRDSK